MSHVLITFLGRGEKDTNDLYQQEEYQFEDDDNKYKTSFFGLAVLEHLKTKGNLLNKIVILGTPSSTWNALYELKGEVEEKYEDDWIALGNAITENFDSPQEEDEEEAKIREHLPSLQKFLTKYLNSIVKGIQCELHVIPYGDSQEKQIAILEKMAECVKELKEKDSVSLDITHGLRHLPMLTVLSAMYLEVVQKVEIAGIYYGAMEIKNRQDGIAPALNLTGLLGIAKWYGALKSFDKDGDYGVFAELLKNEDLATEKVKNPTLHLKNASFFERLFNIPKAAEELKKFHSAFNSQKIQKLQSPARLFGNKLLKHTSWYKDDSSNGTDEQFYQRQRKLAYSFLEKPRQDYSRAAIFAVEAFTTRLCILSGKNIRKHDERDAAKKDFWNKQEIANTDSWNQLVKNKDKRKAFDSLNKLRRTMVHVKLEPEMEQAMKSSTVLEDNLKKWMDELFK